MKKVILLVISLIFLTGCDGNKDANIIIRSDNYANTSDTIVVNSYNKYRLIYSNQTVDENGNITVELKFNKPIQQH